MKWAAAHFCFLSPDRFGGAEELTAGGAWAPLSFSMR
jgi:hypothetical protein